MPAKGALLLRKQVWAHGGTEHLSMVHQATMQPALSFMGGVLSQLPGRKVCTEGIYHNLGLRPLRDKDLGYSTSQVT